MQKKNIKLSKYGLVSIWTLLVSAVFLAIVIGKNIF